MDLVLPGDGFTIFRRIQGSNFALDAMGPLSAGDVIRRIEVFYGFEGAGVLSFSASLGSSNSATDAALDTGRPLINRSSFGAHVSANGAPAWTLLGAAGQSGRFAFYPGLRVATGAGWIVPEVGSHTNGVTVSAMIAIEIWRVVRVKGPTEEDG